MPDLRLCCGSYSNTPHAPTCDVGRALRRLDVEDRAVEEAQERIAADDARLADLADVVAVLSATVVRVRRTRDGYEIRLRLDDEETTPEEASAPPEIRPCRRCGLPADPEISGDVCLPCSLIPVPGEFFGR